MSGSFVLPCTAAQRVRASSFDTDEPDVEKPPVDLPPATSPPGRGTRRAGSCTSTNLAALNSNHRQKMDDNNVRDSSVGVVELMPSVAYDCTQRAADGTVLGRMQWTGTNPGRLTTSGRIFLDGDLRTSNVKRAVGTESVIT